MSVSGTDEANEPVGRSQWEKLILRAEIDNATKLVALAAATYGNPDGTRVNPSVPRLAAEFDWSEKHVQDQISELRRLGLLTVVRKHSPGNPTRYRLSFPAAGIGSLVMRTDVHGFPWIGPRLPKRGGRKPTLTGTPVPVSSEPHRNSSSGESDANQNSSSGESGRIELHTGTPVPITESKPELEFHQTGTGVPSNQNSSSGDHARPCKTPPVSGSNFTPTSASGQNEPAEDHELAEGANPSESPAPSRIGDLDYARAQKFMRTIPPAVRDAALTDARAQLAAEGSPINVSALTVRAAALLQTRDTA